MIIIISSRQKTTLKKNNILYFLQFLSVLCFVLCFNTFLIPYSKADFTEFYDVQKTKCSMSCV